VRIDLPAQTVTGPDGAEYGFGIDAFASGACSRASTTSAYDVEMGFPEDLGRFVQADVVRWKMVIRQGGIKIE
jgi:hypothetical protein